MTRGFRGQQIEDVGDSKWQQDKRNDKNTSRTANDDLQQSLNFNVSVSHCHTKSLWHWWRNDKRISRTANVRPHDEWRMTWNYGHMFDHIFDHKYVKWRMTWNAEWQEMTNDKRISRTANGCVQQVCVLDFDICNEDVTRKSTSKWRHVPGTDFLDTAKFSATNVCEAFGCLRMTWKWRG